MHKYKRKRLIQKLVFSYLTIAVLAVLVIFMGVSVYERYTVERDMAARRAEAEAEVRELKHKAAVMESQVKYLEDERGIEAEIRGRFDVAKEGEQVVIILEDERSTIEPVVAPEPAAEESKPWYKFW